MRFPIRVHADDRRTAWLDGFAGAGLPGDLNVTWVEPGAILAWHRHEQQDDWMLVVEGTLKVGFWRGQQDAPFPGMVTTPQWVVDEARWEVLTDRDPKTLVIERGWWHGYQNIGPGRACVITYITQHYTPQDEFRLAPHLVPLFWDRVAR